MKYKIVRDKTGKISHVETNQKGRGVTDNAKLNKGSAFPDDERKDLGLVGRIPHRIETLDEQVARMYKQFKEKQVKVLVEGLSKKPHLNSAEFVDKPQLVGRTSTDWIVVFNGPKDLAGNFAKVRITKTSPLTLFGVLVQ